MLRTLMLVPLAAALLGAPDLAAAEQFPSSVLHADIRSDTGQVVGRVEAVERDGQGRVIAIQSEALEPADAPRAPMVAEQRESPSVVLLESQRREGGGAGVTPRAR